VTRARPSEGEALFQLLARHADEDLVAVGGDGERTAAALRRDVLAVAGRLPLPTEGAEIAVICADRYLFAVGVLAAWQAGHAVALPPNTQPEVVRELSLRPGVVALLHDTEAREGADLRGWLAQEPAEEGAPVGPLAAISSDRRVATVYTSGSSGEHQACVKTAGQLLGEAALLASTFEIGRGQRIVATVPPHHIYGLLFGTLLPLLAGAAFVRATPFHAETVAAIARELGAEVLVSVPVHLRSLTMLDPGAMPRFLRVFSSGAALPGATAAALAERFGMAVTEVFGSSETGGIGWRIGAESGGPWRPFTGVRVDVDASGRLLLDSPFLPPEAARPAIAGDRVALLADGRFNLLGRYDGVIKVGSRRVSLAEIEGRLLALPELVDAAVVAIEVGGARGHEVLAAVVPRAGAGQPQAVVAAIRQALARWFDPVVVPRRIKVMAAIPREANGKVRRHRLLEALGLAGSGEREAAAAAAAPAARVLARFEVRRSFPERRCFVVRSHAVRALGDGRELHEIVVRVPSEPEEDDLGAALAKLIGRVLSRIRGLGRPTRLRGEGLRRSISPGEALVLALEVERARRSVRFTLRCGAVIATAGVAEYGPAKESELG
jgi:acyl-coenzyme A synthetase/AMP-(fatty) acid ligase